MLPKSFPSGDALARACKSCAAIAILASLLGGCIAGSGDLLRSAPATTPPAVTAPNNAAEREHAQLVSAFGGEYRAPAARAYLERVVSELTPATDRPDERFSVTLLDSPAVNAFALPNGRLYVTRGLLALANDSAELAAVMAHEIAHVTLRHAATRSELEMRSALVTRVVADVLRDRRAAEMVRDTTRMDIARFSREQEIEADLTAVATLARAGYDPYGAARFLRNLDRWVGLATGAAGARVQRAAYDMFATHPATAQRVEAARIAARGFSGPGVGAADRDGYLAVLDGVAFGDNSSDGMVRGREYVHGRLRIGFTAPQGFRLDNSSRAVLGSSSDEARRLLFDLVEGTDGQSLTDVLQATWTDDMRAESLALTNVNGLEAATAASRGREWHFRLAAVRHDGRVYRLIFAFRPRDAGAERLFQETLSSIRPITASDVARLQPPRLRIVRAAPGEDVAAMARRMTGAGGSVEIFRVLNGLDAGDRIEPGRAYKIIVD
ncbi:MAG: hypothetical protein EA385_07420 [Salinarimonadaceae bacterium]|nr:MAG: hypothetical protein EA385_07420 [Salinarimonadaceae bacterium]